MTKQLTKLEILAETYEFYAKNPDNRATTGIKCLYKMSNNDTIKNCAVGRCIDWNTPELALPDFIKSNSPARFVDDDFKALLPQYQNTTLEFWNDVQRWHDTRDNWDMINNKITERGDNQMKRLITKYSQVN